MQVGIPLTTGTVTDKSFLGCKVVSAEFSCEVGGMLMCTLELDGKDCDETQTLAVAAYPAMSPFNFSQMAVKTGTFGTETARSGIRKVSIKVERPQAVDRFYAGGAGLKQEPISNDQVKITGSLEMDYVDVVLDDLHTSDAATSLVWEFLGPIIAATHNETFRIVLPAIRVDEAPPTVEGFDVVKPTISFTGLFDGTNQPKIEYMSTDVSLEHAVTREVRILNTGSLLELQRRLRAAGGENIRASMQRRIRRAAEPLKADLQSTMRGLDIRSQGRGTRPGGSDAG